MSSADLLSTLHKYWGFDSFRPPQEQIIESLLDGRDTVALLPTGGGKSLCFQLPAMVEEGICLVISPLVALMTDQVQKLKDKGIKAMALTGGIKQDELVELLDNAKFGNYKFLYLSPERLRQELVQHAIREMNINFIAVDEAHCISQWGNDFRPAYLEINILRELHPLCPVIALTATATPPVLQDTLEQLKLESPRVFKQSFVRSNLSYEVYNTEDKFHAINDLLSRGEGSAIVYVRSRKAAEELSNRLMHHGLSAAYYHGGLDREKKDQQLKAWLNGKISTMVATNAFGMGIDHPNVRHVIHSQLPDSLESYFQEAGRAGRDNAPAKAIVLYNEADKDLVIKQFVKGLPGPKRLKKLYKKLSNYFQISYGEGEFTEHGFSFEDFCSTYDLNRNLTYNTLQTLDRLGIIRLSQEFGRKSTLKFLVPSDVLLKYFENKPEASLAGKTILRIYGGIFEAPSKVNLDLVSSKTGMSVTKIVKELQDMERDMLIELKLQLTDASITFLQPREDDKVINPLAKDVERLNQKKKEQVQAVIDYIENEQQCRSTQLVSYFGQEESAPCGICSVCTSVKKGVTKADKISISKEIIDLLKKENLNSREITDLITFDTSEVIDVIRLLADAGKIRLNAMNQYELK